MCRESPATEPLHQAAILANAARFHPHLHTGYGRTVIFLHYEVEACSSSVQVRGASTGGNSMAPLGSAGA